VSGNRMGGRKAKLPDDLRANALRLAGVVGVERAAKETGVKAGTIRSWRRRAEVRAARDAVEVDELAALIEEGRRIIAARELRGEEPVEPGEGEREPEPEPEPVPVAAELVREPKKRRRRRRRRARAEPEERAPGPAESDEGAPLSAREVARLMGRGGGEIESGGGAGSRRLRFGSGEAYEPDRNDGRTFGPNDGGR
jgi:hypothetical protein